MQFSKTQPFNLHNIGNVYFFLALMLLFTLPSGTVEGSTHEKPMNIETATFAGGCFWCTEAVYESFEGVKKVTSGYMGGHVENPSYEQVSSGSTGHAEVIHLEFDPSAITFKELVDVFWEAHDPTTLNRQGADVGTMYRSAVFYHSDVQKQIAEASKTEAQSKFKNPIVTEITQASPFYEAENYHQDFYSNNRTYPYCRAIITPKLKKLGIE